MHRKKLKMFVSYSHLDLSYKNSFLDHIAPLVRRGLIEVWSDSAMLAGDNFENGIQLALDASDIFVGLISSNYVASDFCFNIELAQALERQSQETICVIPVIVKSVNWKNLGFDKTIALPDDAIPISLAEDRDLAWTQVAKGIERVVEESQANKPAIKPNIEKWCDDTEVSYQSRNSTAITTLSELFVFPDLRRDEVEVSERTELQSSRRLLTVEDHTVIIGDEQSGKTALCRRLFADILDNSERYPLFIDATAINPSDLQKAFSKALHEQYKFPPELSECVPIIDDADLLPAGAVDLRRLTHFLLGTFTKSIVLIDEVYRLTSDMAVFEEFEVFELLPLANTLRERLIENWLIAAGYKDGQSESDFFREHVDPKKMYIDAFVGKNIVPAKAVYILSILQASDSLTAQNLELTAHGHCYQYLVSEALLRVKIKSNQLDSYINYLTEIAYWIFQSPNAALDEKSYQRFVASYEAKFIPVQNIELMTSKLTESNILSRSKDGLAFKYKYIYYFCVGKKIADNISSAEMKAVFGEVLENLHIEDRSNILIFIVHHTKDSHVLDEIELNLMGSYQEVKPTQLLTEELLFMEEYVNEIPKLVYEANRDHRDARAEAAERQDEAEYAEQKMSTEVAKKEADNELVKITRAIRSIEIAGQIVRNRVGSLERDRLQIVTSETIYCGLRLLRRVLESGEALKEDMISYLEKVIASDSKASRRELEKEARQALYVLMYRVIHGIIRKISSSTGSREVLSIFQNIEKESPDSPAISLIASAVELTHKPKVDIDSLKQRFEDMDGNTVGRRVLQELIIHHLYLYPSGDHTEKQKIASNFRIPVKAQRIIEMRKETKKLTN